jgi:hypothetical protein
MVVRVIMRLRLVLSDVLESGARLSLAEQGWVCACVQKWKDVHANCEL